MSRIPKRFEQLAEAGTKALITFITAGDPRPDATVPLLHRLVAAGVNILEIGVPFSDPMADGPVIQRGNERALAHGVTLAQVLDMVREFRRDDAETPIVLMGYLNPVEAFGYTELAEQASAAGVDGFIVVDLPPEECDGFHRALRANELDLIFLVSPTSSQARIRTIAARASGFLYYVSLKGVTGAAHIDTDAVARQVALVKAESALPVGVGFGIADGASAGRVATAADAVVVGSAIVSRIEAHANDRERYERDVVTLVGEMRQAMDAATSTESIV